MLREKAYLCVTFSGNNMQTLYDKINQELAEGCPTEAIRLAESFPEVNTDATMLYLMGRALMRVGRRRDAMNAFLRSRQLDPNGPASEALALLGNIMSFYYKDLYNP